MIARCVEENLDARPPSIHAVIASLPGGDPLQAAIDAGETPSPAMVAAAGEPGDLQPAVAWSILIATILTLAAVAMLFANTFLFRMVPLPKPPEALIERATAVLEQAGYPTAANDSAHFFSLDSDYLDSVLNDPSPDRWKDVGRTRPGAIRFGYRQSPRTLLPSSDDGRVFLDDPPLTVPGMTHISLDTSGRLVAFVAVPPERADTPRTQTPDWTPFFKLAGGDLEGLRPVESHWSSPVDNDEKFAWEGRFRGQPGVPIRIEAASHRGKPVLFAIVAPWETPAGIAPPDRAGRTAIGLVGLMVTIVVLAAAAFIARRNLRRGRGDRKGALRLAAIGFLAVMVGYLFRMAHAPDVVSEWTLIVRALKTALYSGASLWLVYVAAEPYIRRRWPHTLIAWNRLIAGRLRDPMVGRDIAVGMFAGAMVMLLQVLMIHAPLLIGKPAFAPVAGWLSPLTGSHHLVFALFDSLLIGITRGAGTLFMLVIALAIVRKRWAAVGLVGVFMMVMNGPGALPIEDRVHTFAVPLIFGVVIAVIIMFVAVRFGLIALLTVHFMTGVMHAAPLTLDTSAWYFGRSAMVLVVLVALAAYGFHTALGQKPVFGTPLLEES